jgi:phospholipid/cholesterol/gamma-HCH transport system ATP-binding protein
MNNENSKIIVTDLCKSFGPKKVLEGINLNIKEGESLVIIGGSGSGKSVLLKSIIGLIKPESGSVKVDGEETLGLSEKEYAHIIKKFGFLFQGGALFDSLTVWENICFGLLQRQKMNKAEAKEIAIRKLQSVGLKEDVADLFPSELSGGMQKRVSLARSVAENPEIIFFDEPTTGLDPIMANIINDLIIRCSEELGATTITITHDMESARKIADNVAMIHKGKIIWHGTVEEMDKTDNEFVRQFINGEIEGPIQMEVQDH